VATAELANSAVTNAKLASDVARANLLTNGGFEIWQRGTSGLGPGYTADRWSAGIGSGSSFNATIQRDSANADTSFGSTYCWSCTNYTHSAVSILDQAVEANGPGLRGRPVTFSMRVRTNVANHIRLQLIDVDGSSLGTSAFHSGGNTYETLSVTGTPNATTAGGKILCRVQFNATSTVNLLDNAMLVIGSVAVDYLPRHPADDLMRCLRYYEVLGPNATASLEVSAYSTAGGTPSETFQYHPKGVIPTVTKVGTWPVANCSQPTIAGPDTDSCYLTITVTAAGIGNTWNGNAGNKITVEANP
jgi:hypothetical protein